MALIEKLTAIANGFRSSRGITNRLSLDEMATLAAEPLGGESKLPQVVDRSITEITADDLEGATQIGSHAFYSCRSLTRVIIPDSAVNIGLSTFSYCENLTNVAIGNGVWQIKSYAFEYCNSLTNLTIPSSVTDIGNSALSIGTTTNKATITFLGTTPPTINASTFYGTKLKKIIVPAGYGDVYRNATNWANFADYIEEAAI